MSGANSRMEGMRHVSQQRAGITMVMTLLAFALPATAFAQPADTNLPRKSRTEFPPSDAPASSALTDQHVSIPGFGTVPDIKRVVIGKKAVFKLCPTCSNIDVGPGSEVDLALQQLQRVQAQLQQAQTQLKQLESRVEKAEKERQKWLDDVAAKLLAVAQQVPHKNSSSYKEPAKPASAEDAIDKRTLYVCKQVGAACE